MAARRQVQRSIALPAPAPAVWRALTDGTLLQRWLAPEVQFEARPGARGWLREADGSRRALLVDAAEPGRRLTLRWWHDGDPDAGGGASVVDIELTEDPGATLLTVTETELADHELWLPDGTDAAGARAAGRR